jgi:hypothetical protein
LGGAGEGDACGHACGTSLPATSFRRAAWRGHAGCGWARFKQGQCWCRESGSAGITLDREVDMTGTAGKPGCRRGGWSVRQPKTAWRAVLGPCWLPEKWRHRPLGFKKVTEERLVRHDAEPLPPACRGDAHRWGALLALPAGCRSSDLDAARASNDRWARRERRAGGAPPAAHQGPVQGRVRVRGPTPGAQSFMAPLLHRYLARQCQNQQQGMGNQGHRMPLPRIASGSDS